MWKNIMIVVLAMLVVGGGATAAADPTLITGAKVKNHSLTGADIRNGSIVKANLSPAVVASMTGDPGSSGSSGAAGTQGPVGPRGPQGPKGDTVTVSGNTVVGPKGDTGAAGPAGAPGPEGPQGATGPAGPAGPPGNGSVGHWEYGRDTRDNATFAEAECPTANFGGGGTSVAISGSLSYVNLPQNVPPPAISQSYAWTTAHTGHDYWAFYTTAPANMVVTVACWVAGS